MSIKALTNSLLSSFLQFAFFFPSYFIIVENPWHAGAGSKVHRSFRSVLLAVTLLQLVNWTKYLVRRITDHIWRAPILSCETSPPNSAMSWISKIVNDPTSAVPTDPITFNISLGTRCNFHKHTGNFILESGKLIFLPVYAFSYPRLIYTDKPDREFITEWLCSLDNWRINISWGY